MKCWLSGCVTSHSIDVAKHVMDVVFILLRLDVERAITLKVLNDTLIGYICIPTAYFFKILISNILQQFIVEI